MISYLLLCNGYDGCCLFGGSRCWEVGSGGRHMRCWCCCWIHLMCRWMCRQTHRGMCCDMSCRMCRWMRWWFQCRRHDRHATRNERVKGALASPSKWRVPRIIQPLGSSEDLQVVIWDIMSHFHPLLDQSIGYYSSSWGIMPNYHIECPISSS